jgi:hypothetical protein
MPIRALEMCVTFPVQHMIDQFHQSEQFLTLFQNLWCSVELVAQQLTMH